MRLESVRCFPVQDLGLAVACSWAPPRHVLITQWVTVLVQIRMQCLSLLCVKEFLFQ